MRLESNTAGTDEPTHEPARTHHQGELRQALRSAAREEMEARGLVQERDEVYGANLILKGRVSDLENQLRVRELELECARTRSEGAAVEGEAVVARVGKLASGEHAHAGDAAGVSNDEDKIKREEAERERDVERARREEAEILSKTLRIALEAEVQVERARCDAMERPMHTHKHTHKHTHLTRHKYAGVMRWSGVRTHARKRTHF
jgi:hypothetical protein